MLAETERGSRWPLQRRRRSARARRTRPGSRAPSHEDRFWTYLPTWSVIGRLRILGFAPASVSDAQMVPVGQQCHSGLPTGLTSEADVEGISLEVLQLALSQLTIVEPCLDVSAQNALPMTVSLGESPQHEVVQDWRNQLGALDLYRFVWVGVSATMHVFRVGLFSDRHFALIRGLNIGQPDRCGTAIRQPTLGLAHRQLETGSRQPRARDAARNGADRARGPAMSEASYGTMMRRFSTSVTPGAPHAVSTASSMALHDSTDPSR